MPVDETANTNLPSLAPSRAKTACQRESSIKFVMSNRLGASTFEIVLFMDQTLSTSENSGYPHLAVKPIFLSPNVNDLSGCTLAQVIRQGLLPWPHLDSICGE